MRRRRKGNIEVWAWVAIIVFILVIILAADINEMLTAQAVTATVLEKEYVDGHYLIFTDVDVFMNEDNFAAGKLNSSDAYRDIKIGKTYEFKVGGYRVPFMSWYKNILEYKEL